MSGRIRLDQLLLNLGHVPSRARARDAIKRGCVTVNGDVVAKAGSLVDPSAKVILSDPASGYVSRAALKLIHAIEAFSLDFAGRHVLDIGASTGGFTQVALEHGADHVIALDVGHDQMAPMLKTDQRVTVIEGLNARHLTAEHLGKKPDALVCDVSFISLKLALPNALALAAPAAFGVFLIKPQFEVGRENIGKGGLVTDQAKSLAVRDDLCDWLNDQPGWQVMGSCTSPIEGSDGNVEYLMAASKDLA